VEELVRPETEHLQDRGVERAQVALDEAREPVIDPAAPARRTVGQLVRERPLALVEVPRDRREGPIEPLPTLRAAPGFEGRFPSGARSGQSNIPRVGEDGTAISRDGMRPAR